MEDGSRPERTIEISLGVERQGCSPRYHWEQVLMKVAPWRGARLFSHSFRVSAELGSSSRDDGQSSKDG
jgi:hypothetical protein